MRAEINYLGLTADVNEAKYTFYKLFRKNGRPGDVVFFKGLKIVMEANATNLRFLEQFLKIDRQFQDPNIADPTPSEIFKPFTLIVYDPLGYKIRELELIDAHIKNHKEIFDILQYNKGKKNTSFTVEIKVVSAIQRIDKKALNVYQWHYSDFALPEYQSPVNAVEDEEKIEVKKIGGDKIVYKGGVHDFKILEFTKQDYKSNEIIHKIKWKYSIDDGELVDIEDKAKLINDEIILELKIPKEKGQKIKVSAFIEKFNKDVNTESKILNGGKAILIAFPEDDPEIPTNQGFYRWVEETFGDGDHKVNNAGHAGIIIVTMVDEANNPKGRTKYFDFGRYNLREKELGKRGQNEGVVRSSDFSAAFRIPDWDFKKTDLDNAKAIMQTLINKGKFKGYGKMIGAVANDLDFNKMMEYALFMQNRGLISFGGHTNSSEKNNDTYCAKFARGVAECGGMDWDWDSLTGEASVNDVIETYEVEKIIISNK